MAQPSLNTSAAFTGADAGSGSARDFSGSITIPAGLTDSVLVAKVGVYQGNTTDIKLGGSGGTPLTALGSVYQYDANTTIQLWYLVAPPSGTYTALNVDCNAPPSNYPMGSIIVEVWENVDQTNPFVDQGGSVFEIGEQNAGVVPSIDITSTTDGVATDGVMYAATGRTPGAGQTATQTDIQEGTPSYYSGSYEAGSGTITMSWSNSQYGGHVVTVLNPTSGGDTTAPTPGQAVITIPVTSDGA